MLSTLLLAALSVPLLGAVPYGALHLRLVRAEPAANGTVTTAPTDIRLFFSEVPEVRVTTVVLTDASDRKLEMGTAVANRHDAKIVSVPINGKVIAGAYKVEWKTMARDGHVVSGTFNFTFTAAQ